MSFLHLIFRYRRTEESIYKWNIKEQITVLKSHFDANFLMKSFLQLLLYFLTSNKCNKDPMVQNHLWTGNSCVIILRHWKLMLHFARGVHQILQCETNINTS